MMEPAVSWLAVVAAVTVAGIGTLWFTEDTGPHWVTATGLCVAVAGSAALVITAVGLLVVRIT